MRPFLKSGLKSNEEPLELTQPVQKQFIFRCLTPLIAQLIKSTAELDELFASNYLGMIGNYSMVGTPGGNANWNIHLPGAEKQTALEQLEDSLNKGRFFSTLQISFSWQGFKKAGSNAFQDGFQLEFRFDRFNYELKVTHGGIQLMESKRVYQNCLSEEEISKLVTACVEACLQYVETQTK